MEATWENIAFRGSSSRAAPMRLYDGATHGKVPPLVLYLRGGAFLDEERSQDETAVARTLADSGAVVLEADYGSVSQCLFPQAMEAAFAALACLNGRRKQFGGARSVLLVAGDEAGGNIAAGVALKARDLLPNALAGQILLSPMVDPTMSTASIRRASDIGMGERWSDGWSHYLGSSAGFQHPYAAPCLCSRLAGIAPALIVTSQDDPLKDEVLGYAERLSQAGVPVQQSVYPSDSGWTGIYSETDGPWKRALGADFTAFVLTLSS